MLEKMKLEASKISCIKNDDIDEYSKDSMNKIKGDENIEINSNFLHSSNINLANNNSTNVGKINDEECNSDDNTDDIEEIIWI